jgi:uncharacterized membrane protein
MKKNVINLSFLIIGLIVGILIIFSPVIITGASYDVQRVMGNLLVAEFILRTSSLIIGLLVVYDAMKTFSKKY